MPPLGVARGSRPPWSVSRLPLRPSVAAVLSGGQTGVDRAALDAALAAGLSTGGWCPAGRWAEDGPISRRYLLRETESSDPAVRTCRNVDDADALLVLAPAPLAGGTACALEHARAVGKPVLVVDPAGSDAVDCVARWVTAWRLSPVLNVSGPRASEWPAGYEVARTVLDALFHRVGCGG